MADIILTITIPEEKISKAAEGFLKMYPNTETIDDPKWIDPKDGSEAPQVPKYTTKQWVNEKLRRDFVRDVRRGLTMINRENASVPIDDSMATIQK